MNAQPWPHWSEFVDALRPWSRGGWMRLPGGGLLVCHTPRVAPLAYLHRVYPPLTARGLALAEEAYGGRFPLPFRSFLGAANGCRLFGGTLAINGSLISEDGLERISRDPEDPLGQPLSLRHGNWNRTPASVSLSIGGLVGSSAMGELILEDSGEVALAHSEDRSDVAERWPSFTAMLFSELARLSPLFDAHGRFLGGPAEKLPISARRWEATTTRRR